jgi:hypothetical protein
VAEERAAACLPQRAPLCSAAMNDQLGFLALIDDRLEAAGIPYMITGSFAMAVYAIPRMTRDIDLVVSLEEAQVAAFVTAFAEDCYLERAAVEEAIAGQGMFNAIHRTWHLKADFIVRKDEPYRRIEFERRRQLAFAGRSYPIVSAEDLLLSKLHWRRESQSELQLRDVEQILAAQPVLDWTYLRQWAAELGVLAELERLRD